MTALSSPYRWLPSLSAALGEELVRARVEGVLSGRGWISLRVEGRYLWIVALGGLRALWLDSLPLPMEYALALGSHQRSPFAPLLKNGVVDTVACLRGESGKLEGFRLEFDSGRRLCAAFWPRPGHIWVEDVRGGILSVSPPQVHPESLEVVAEEPAAETFDLQAHARACRELLLSHLRHSMQRRVRDSVKARKRKAERLEASLAEDAESASAAATSREQADLLAANLSRVPSGQNEVEILDFQGQQTTLRLDPSLTPAANLDKLYRRAAKAERAVAHLATRREQVAAERKRAHELEKELEEIEEIEDLLRFARAVGIDLRPSTPGEHRGFRAKKGKRLPYKIFVLLSGREVWIGKSAADNDELSFSRAAPADLWLHAGGVEGSHVVLRCSEGQASKSEIEAAAQLAALFSKAKGSTTVPVWITERRYVRKPRKSPAGVAAPQRARTLFVSPRQPEGHWLSPESSP
jgi:hypothetical protein